MLLLIAVCLGSILIGFLLGWKAKEWWSRFQRRGMIRTFKLKKGITLEDAVKGREQMANSGSSELTDASMTPQEPIATPTSLLREFLLAQVWPPANLEEWVEFTRLAGGFGLAQIRASSVATMSSKSGATPLTISATQGVPNMGRHAQNSANRSSSGQTASGDATPR